MKDFIRMINRTKEFKELSHMAIGEIFKECELVELDSSKSNSGVYNIIDD